MSLPVKTAFFFFLQLNREEEKKDPTDAGAVSRCGKTAIVVLYSSSKEVGTLNFELDRCSLVYQFEFLRKKWCLPTASVRKGSLDL